MILESRPLDGLCGHEAGRQLLAQLYRRETGEDLPPILKTNRGKPYVVDSGWHFSISHTNRRVFCALSRRNIAVDAEECGCNESEGFLETLVFPSAIIIGADVSKKDDCIIVCKVMRFAEPNDFIVRAMQVACIVYHLCSPFVVFCIVYRRSVIKHDPFRKQSETIGKRQTVHKNYIKWICFCPAFFEIIIVFAEIIIELCKKTARQCMTRRLRCNIRFSLSCTF